MALPPNRVKQLTLSPSFLYAIAVCYGETPHSNSTLMSALKKSSNKIPPEPTTTDFLDIVRKSAYLWAKVGTFGRISINALPELMMT